MAVRLARALTGIGVLMVMGCASAIPGSSGSVHDARPSAVQVARSSARSSGPSSAPSATASVTPIPDEVLPSDLDPGLRQIVDLRRSYGLRHDLAFVIAAATDPAARINFFPFPMYPSEEIAFLRAQAAQEVAIHAVEKHAADHLAEYGGVYIDRQEHPGMVIALWTDHLAEHEAAIREVLGADSIVTMRQVRYSETFLRTLQDEVFADREWMEAIPAHMTGVGTDITENAVIINVSSAVHDAAEQIAGHFAQGDALRVVSDGTGEVLIPSGLVKGKVVAADGGPIGARRLWLDEVGDAPGGCGGGDMGYGVGADGRFEYPCQIGDRTIVIYQDDAVGDGSHEVGRAEVTVTEGATEVTIRLAPEP